MKILSILFIFLNILAIMTVNGGKKRQSASKQDLLTAWKQDNQLFNFIDIENDNYCCTKCQYKSDTTYKHNILTHLNTCTVIAQEYSHLQHRHKPNNIEKVNNLNQWQVEDPIFNFISINEEIKYVCDACKFISNSDNKHIILHHLAVCKGIKRQGYGQLQQQYKLNYNEKVNILKEWQLEDPIFNFISVNEEKNKYFCNACSHIRDTDHKNNIKQHLDRCLAKRNSQPKEASHYPQPLEKQQYDYPPYNQLKRGPKNKQKPSQIQHNQQQFNYPYYQQPNQGFQLTHELPPTEQPHNFSLYNPHYYFNTVPQQGHQTEQELIDWEVRKQEEEDLQKALRDSMRDQGPQGPLRIGGSQQNEGISSKGNVDPKDKGKGKLLDLNEFPDNDN